MQQQRQTRSSSTDPALTEHTGQLMKLHTGASIPYFDPVSPENEEPIEKLLERYGFQYILERVKKTISAFPALQHQAEDIVSEVYDKSWQRLLTATVHNPPAYIGRMKRQKHIDHMRRYMSDACQSEH